MSTLTIRQVPDEVAAVLKERARHHGRSMEAQVRHVLELYTDGPGELSRPQEPGLGTRIARRCEGLLDEAFPLPSRTPEKSRPSPFGDE
jgi:plasmid stability protein